MDIEGMEHRVVSGGLGFFREQKPVTFMEYSPRFQQIGSDVDGAALLKLFLEMGYGIEMLPRTQPRFRIDQTSSNDVIEAVHTLWRRHVEEDDGTHLDLCLHPGAAAP
jgi:hypothetical protein